MKTNRTSEAAAIRRHFRHVLLLEALALALAIGLTAIVIQACLTHH